MRCSPAAACCAWPRSAADVDTACESRLATEGRRAWPGMGPGPRAENEVERVLIVVWFRQLHHGSRFGVGGAGWVSGSQIGQSVGFRRGRVCVREV